MKEARDSVWAVVPFAAGVGAVRYSLAYFYAHPRLMAWAVVMSVLGLVAAGLWAVAVAFYGNKSDFRQRRSVVALLFLFAGFTVCFLANLPSGGFAGASGTGVSGAAGVGSASAGSLSEDLGLFGGRLSQFISDCGERFRNMIDRIPYGDEMSNALVKALLAGDRSSLSWDIRNIFRDAGASHLLALSGLHLSVIYLIFSKILSVTGNSPAMVKVRSILIILGSLFFTLITGASPSLVRAFLFILLRECAVILRRQTDTVNIFLMALMLQLALAPNNIASVGFQLSYLAMLGIVLVNPLLEGLWDLAGTLWHRPSHETRLEMDGNAEERSCPALADGSNDSSGTKKTTVETEDGDEIGSEGEIGVKREIGKETEIVERGNWFGKAMRKIWSLCTLSISCQIFTAPAVLLYFGTFPRYFLITNLLCLPLSNVLITVSVITVVLSMLGICPAFLLTLTDILVRALLSILDIIASL